MWWYPAGGAARSRPLTFRDPPRRLESRLQAALFGRRLPQREGMCVGQAWGKGSANGVLSGGFAAWVIARLLLRHGVDPLGPRVHSFATLVSSPGRFCPFPYTRLLVPGGAHEC